MNPDWRARIELPYGSEVALAALPEGWSLDLLSVMGPADLPEPERALKQALDAPIHSLPFAQRLPATGPVLVVLSPDGRPGGSLDFLIQAMLARGLQRRDIHLMVARSGTRALGPLGLEALLGAERLAAHPCFEHDPDAPARSCGRTARGVPVEFNARLRDYRLLVLVAPVSHHPVYGFSGGRDVLAAGAVSRRTAEALSALALGVGEGLESGRLKGNLLHDELGEVAGLCGQPVFAVNWIAGSRPGGVAGFWAGELQRAFRRACQVYLGWRSFPVLAPGYDLVLSGSGGAPADDEAERVVEGMLNACRLLKPDGRLLHLARCGQGWSLPEASLRRLHARSQTQRLHLVSQVAADVSAIPGLRLWRDLADALPAILAELPAEPVVALFPDAMELLPVHA